jgi:hypothetical protein
MRFFRLNKFCILTLVLCGLCSYSQIDNANLEVPIVQDHDSTAKKLSFKADIVSFLKNNEYFNDYMDGYTLFGYWANPRLYYQAHKKVSIEAGVFASREFGSSGFDTLMPTLSLRIKEKNWNFIFGNLEGAYNHRQIEPVYNFEKGITSPVEQGFQAKYVKNQTFLDAWVDWQLFTKPGKTNQEHISGNLVYRHKPFELGKFNMVFPLQFNVFHKGGQNINAKLPVLTIYNLSLGNVIGFKLTKSKKILLENYLLGYKQDTASGFGYMCNLRFQSKKFQLITTYWHGNSYDSPQGGDLYQSSSRKLGSVFYQTQNNLLIFRGIYSTKITKELSMDIRFEPNYNLRTGKFEHSEGLYFVYRLPNVGLF